MERTKDNGRRILWTVTEGLLALLLGITPMVSTSNVLGYSIHVGYLTMLGALLNITSLGGLGTLAGEEWWIFLFYTVIVTGVLVLCVVMAVKAWKGRGRIIYLVGNALAFLLVVAIIMMVKALTKSLMADDTDIIKVGLGYWLAMVLAVIGFGFGILNLGNKRTASDRAEEFEKKVSFADLKRKAEKSFTRRKEECGRVSGRPSAGGHVKRPMREGDSTPYTDYMDTPSASHVSGTETCAAGPVSRPGVFASEYREKSSGAVERRYTAADERTAGSFKMVTEDTSSHSTVKKEPEPSVKVKYNMKNSGKPSEFFHRDDELS